MGPIKINDNIPVSPYQWIYEQDINPVNFVLAGTCRGDIGRKLKYDQRATHMFLIQYVVYYYKFYFYYLLVYNAIVNINTHTHKYRMIYFILNQYFSLFLRLKQTESVLFRFTASGCSFCIFKLFLDMVHAINFSHAGMEIGFSLYKKIN
jgi:hypothetical protein